MNQKPIDDLARALFQDFHYDSKFPFCATFVDSYTDAIMSTRHGSNYRTLKQNILSELRTKYNFPKGVYDNTNYLVMYIYDESFRSDMGKRRLARMQAHGWYLEPEVFYTRGMDYDEWHDHYLTSEERELYDAQKAR